MRPQSPPLNPRPELLHLLRHQAPPLYHAIRAESLVLSPSELEAMLASAIPVSLQPPAVQMAMIREAFIRQNFPPSQPAPKVAEPDQRGFIIGGQRL